MKIYTRLLGTLTKSERRKYELLVSLKAITGILDVLGLFLIGLISAVAVATSEGDSVVRIAGIEFRNLSESEIFTLVLLVLLVFLTKSLLALFLTQKITKLMGQIEVRVSGNIVSTFMSEPLSEPSRLSKSDLQWAVGGSTAAAYTGLLNRFSIIVSESVLLGLILITFLFINVVATFVTAVYFIILVLAIQLVWSRSLKIAGVEITKGSVGTTTVLNDIYDGFREIYAYNGYSLFMAEFVKQRKKLAFSEAKITFLVGMPRYIVETALMLGVVLFVAWQFSTGELATGIVTVGVFLTGGVRMMASLLPLQNSAALITAESEKAASAIEQTYTHSDTYLDTTTIPQSIPEDTAASVEISHLSFQYPGNETSALEDVTISVSPGQRVAIIGSSGSGKSTLADTILGLHSPTSGEVFIQGLSPQEIISLFPGYVGYVPQKPTAVSATISENIALGIEKAHIDEGRIAEVLKLAHLDAFVSTLPQGNSTEIGPHGQQLSGGQMQRLGIARALYRGPKLLILDEATSALDGTSENSITETISELGSSVTVITIAHRLSTIKNSDVIFIMENSRVTHKGTFEKLEKEVPIMQEFIRHSQID